MNYVKIITFEKRGKMMKRIAIVGMQWGDEGKGKMTDFLAQDADVVIRYQGGDNAGHTVMFDDQKIDLHLLPSGAIHKHTLNILAHGMVINLETLFAELKKFPHAKILISDRAHLILPFHKSIDIESEKTQNIGTTKKGIGPAYADKILRKGVRVASLLDRNRFIKDCESLANSHGYTFDAALFYDTYKNEIEALKLSISYIPKHMSHFITNHQRILFEGAQGVMLDVDHGTYPYVTSSSPSVSSIAQNVGCAPWHIEGALGIMKAYSTRVGEGPFPTEIEGELAHNIRELAREYGTTTGRARRIGYLDLVQLKHTVLSSGITHVALMLLDIIHLMPEIKVCYRYLLEGEEIDYMPAHIEDVKKVKPLFKTLNPIKLDITQITSYDALPQEAKDYITFIETQLDIPVSFISVGPKRNQTIKRIDIWED
jgi:adenylosuccinate synthase